MGRPLTELFPCYLEDCRKQKVQRVCDGVHLSSSSLALFEYITVRAAYCSNAYPSSCNECNLFRKVANKVLEQGYCSLSEAFKMVSPGVKYSAEHAKRKILQMPLVCVCVGEPFSGKSSCILIEKFQFCDYYKINLE